MAVYSWLGRFRKTARSTFFEILRQALTTDDGRRILTDSLPGLTLQPALPYLPPSPYQRDATHSMPGRRPIFVTARFRTGSTLLWQLFRHLPGCTAYYEPLNERRWFSATARGTHVDRSHGVDDYWREYNGLDHLERLYRPEWTSRALYMARTASDPGLHAYITSLIAAAPARPVLQFNRVDFRLEWLRQHFPDAVLLHLYRHPRDQWCSTLGGHHFPLDGSVAAFAAQDRFYLLSWAQDLSYYFPFLDPRHAVHPYELFYYIWRLSFAFGQLWADLSISYEELCHAPQPVLHQICAVSGIGDADIGVLQSLVVAGAATPRWQNYADDGWFSTIEDRCDAVLTRTFRRTLRGGKPAASASEKVVA